MGRSWTCSRCNVSYKIDAVPGIYDRLLFLNFNLPLWHFTRLLVVRTLLVTSSKEILSIRTLFPKGTKASEKTLTYTPSFDMSLSTFRSQRTKSPFIPRTHTSSCLGINMPIQTFFHILTISMFVIEPACHQPATRKRGKGEGVGTFRHLANVVFVEKFTDVTFFAET
jgi:hypothetical protein